MTPERILDWTNVAATASGRRVLAQIIREAGDGTDTFIAGAPDKTAYFCGRASMAMLIKMHLAEVSSTIFHEILIDQIKKEDLTRKIKKVEENV